MKNIIGLTATTRIGCRISVDHPKTSTIYLSGAVTSTMKSRGSNANTKWTVPIHIRWLRSCSIHFTIKCMSVQTVYHRINLAAKKRRISALSGTVMKSEKCSKKCSQRECLHGCLPTMAWNGTRNKCTSTRQV